MRLDQFTLKAQEALSAAQTRAEKSDHPEFTTEHLLAALLEQEGGVVPSALGKLGANPATVQQEIERSLKSLPAAQGAQTHVSPRLDAALKQALREAEALKDQYVSTEHLLLALLESKTPAGEILKRAGASRDGLLKVLREIRGTQRVDSPNAEDRYQALERYGRDLTELARKGKLDPVIGRDEEIRRVMQVLSRRTKNNPVLIGEPGRGQDRHRRGPGPAHRLGRRARVAQGQAGAGARHGAAMLGRRQVPRRVRGAPQGRAQGGHRTPRARSSCSSTSCTPWSARARPRVRWTPPTCSSRRWRAASCTASAPPRSTSTASTSRRTRPWSGASSRFSSMSRVWLRPSPSCAA